MRRGKLRKSSAPQQETETPAKNRREGASESPGAQRRECSAGPARGRQKSRAARLLANLDCLERDCGKNRARVGLPALSSGRGAKGFFVHSSPVTTVSPLYDL